MASRSFSITHSQKKENGTMELMNFDFNGNGIRLVEIDGEPWFVAADVYHILYGRRTGISGNNKVLSSDEKKLLRKHSAPDALCSLFTGTTHTLALISESGLYKLIMRSDKREARVFQDWVTGTVLPAIRKDGMYVQGEEKVATGELSDDELYMMTIERFKMKAERLQEEKNRLEHDHDRHLKFMSVSEYFSLRHIYPERGSSTSLAHRAKKICLREGITRNKQQRYLPVKDQVVEVFEYPAWVLDEAYDSLVDDRKILSDIPQQELRLVG
jgi:prophage antirepressor-like protein